MNISDKEYELMVKKASARSPKTKDFFWAFFVGGLICAVGEIIGIIYKKAGIKSEIADILIPCTLIFISALLTGLKLFEKIAKRAGAGTLVPITGFANAIVSPAIEFKNEGKVLGVGAKIFSIAGPVILYGTVASAIYGVIYYIYLSVM